MKEVVLLGQNVNGYHDASPDAAALFPSNTTYQTSSSGFSNVFNSRQRSNPGARFSDLLATIAEIDPELRVRFTSPHPKDFPPDVLQAIASYPNLCSSLHMPLQSGSNSTLVRMRRGYSREAFLDLVEHARALIPHVTISTDVIAGFCGETEEEHRDTLDIMERVRFDQAFMFHYSRRDKTHAARHFEDDVPQEVKLRRLQEIIDVFRTKAVEKNRELETGATHLVLTEGLSHKKHQLIAEEGTSSSNNRFVQMTGKTDGNKRVVFSVPLADTTSSSSSSSSSSAVLLPQFDAQNSDLKLLPTDEIVLNAYSSSTSTSNESSSSSSCVTDIAALNGKYIAVKIIDGNGTTLKGVALGESSIQKWSQSGRL